MIELTSEAFREHAIPLIYKTMGKVIGDDAITSPIFKDEKREGWTGWGLWDKKVLVGLCGLWEPKGETVGKIWLSYFAVHPDYQRRGIGKWMLEQMEAEAKRRSKIYLFIETYQHPLFLKANAFYAKNGYVVGGYLENNKPDNTTLIYYKKNLFDSLLKRNNNG